MEEALVTLKLDRDEVESLQGVIHEALAKGSPLVARAAKEVADVLAKAMISQIPGLKEVARDQIAEIESDLREAGAPEEVFEQLREIAEAADAAPITEAEVDGVDMESLLEKALREGKPDETS